MTDSYMPLQRQPSRKSKKMRTVRTILSPYHFDQLLIEARARVMTPEVLVRALLEHILRDNLVEAVLDDKYDAKDDFAKSIDLAYETIRARKAAGGKGWEPP